ARERPTIRRPGGSVGSIAMPPPVLLAVADDPAALDDVAGHLTRRYGHDYRVERASAPEEALGVLAQLAETGDEGALVLAAGTRGATDGRALPARARRLPPHARRGLMVGWGALADPPSAQAILDAIALGRMDYYVPWPAGTQDEVFHHTISAFLLEWAT